MYQPRNITRAANIVIIYIYINIYYIYIYILHIYIYILYIYYIYITYKYLLYTLYHRSSSVAPVGFPSRKPSHGPMIGAFLGPLFWNGAQRMENDSTIFGSLKFLLVPFMYNYMFFNPITTIVDSQLFFLVPWNHVEVQAYLGWKSQLIN